MKIDFPTSIKISETPDDWASYIDDLVTVLDSDYILLTGIGESFNYSKIIIKNIGTEPVEIINLASNSVQKVYELERKIRGSNLIIVAIGGGKVCDLSKRLAYFTGLRLVLLPTIIANDGLISPISVLSDNQKSFSLPGKMPDYVFVDLDIIRSSPPQFLIAAACDLLSNLSATSDWKYAVEQKEATLNLLALHFSNMAAYMILDCSSWDLNAPEFLRAILHGQILSAMAMAYAGNSRPCSGSEHLISHALDELKLGSDMLHGEKVGRASSFCLHIQGKEDLKINKLLGKFNVPSSFTNEVLDDQTLKQIFEVARTVRPGRGTILDLFEDDELIIKYKEFQMNIEDALVQ